MPRLNALARPLGLTITGLLVIMTGVVTAACSQSKSLDPAEESQYAELGSSPASTCACTTDADCPTTSFCDNLTYGPWHCTAKLGLGGNCSEARECKSATCTNWVCATPPPPPPACKAVGKRCKADTECCAGFCSNLDTGYGYGYGYGGYGGYGYGFNFSYCSAPQPNGSSCTANNQCTSGRCDQYECKAAANACAALGKTCNTTSDCCGNLYCNGQTYVGPTCETPGAAGDYCQDASWCQSGNCVSYVCQ